MPAPRDAGALGLWVRHLSRENRCGIPLLHQGLTPASQTRHKGMDPSPWHLLVLLPAPRWELWSTKARLWQGSHREAGWRTE